MAPMSLVTYEETRPWAKAIKQRVVTRNMPPWHLDKTVGIQQFQNDMSLSDEQISTIARWVDAGAPLGDPKDMPAPKQWPKDDGWQLAKQFGQPDLVISVRPLHDAGQGPGRVVQAADADSDLPSRAGSARWRCDPGRPPGAGSRITRSPIFSRKSPERTRDS